MPTSTELPMTTQRLTSRPLRLLTAVVWFLVGIGLILALGLNISHGVGNGLVWGRGGLVGSRGGGGVGRGRDMDRSRGRVGGGGVNSMSYNRSRVSNMGHRVSNMGYRVGYVGEMSSRVDSVVSNWVNGMSHMSHWVVDGMVRYWVNQGGVVCEMGDAVGAATDNTNKDCTEECLHVCFVCARPDGISHLAHHAPLVHPVPHHAVHHPVAHVAHPVHPVAHHAVHPAAHLAHVAHPVPHHAHPVAHVAHPAPVVAHAVHAAPAYPPPAPAYPAPAPAPYKPAPAPYKPVAHPVAYVEPEGKDEPYAYQYGVADDYSKANFKAAETADGSGLVSGEYSVALPDGRIQHVKYTSDHYNGYVAEVTYEGQAVYPEAK